MTLDPQFFRRTDSPVDGPPRELVGYGEHPPRVRWQDGGYVGVAFHTRLYGPTFDHIRLRLSR